MTAFEEAIAALSAGEEADRIYAAEDIGFANRAEGVPPLLARLPLEPSRAAREAIFTALGQIADPSAVAGLTALLDHADPFLRNQAVECLRVRGADTVRDLERAFAEGDRDRRKLVLDVLSGLDSPGVARIYTMALDDEDINVVITAVESLANAKRSEFRESIENLVTAEAHPMLLGVCLEALARMGDAYSIAVIHQKLGGQASTGFLRPSYLKLLGMAGTVDVVAEILGLVGGGELDPATLGALGALRARYGRLALPESLTGARRNSVASTWATSHEAYQAVRLLGGVPTNPNLIGFLETCLEHPDKSLRIGAIEALREAGPAGAESLLRRQALERDEEVLQVLCPQGLVQ